MRREKVLNFAAVVLFIAIVAFLAFWLSHPSPFVLRATWRTRGHIVQIAFSPKGDILAATVVGEGFASISMKWAVGYVSRAKSLSPASIGVNLWQVPSGKSAQSWTLVKFASGGIGPNSLAFSPDGRLLAVGYEERGVNKICVFKVADGRKLKTIVMGKSSVPPSAAFAPDGKLAVTHNGRLWFVKVESGEKIQTEIQASRVTFSPDGRLIAAYSNLWNFVVIFDAKGQLVQQLKASDRTNRFVRKSIFSRDGQKFVCLWQDWKYVGLYLQVRWGVSVWRTKDWKLERSMPLTPFQTLTEGDGDIKFDGSLVAVPKISLTGWDKLWWRLKRFFNNLFARLLGSPIALSNPPLKVSVYRLEDGQLVADWNDAYGAVFSPDGRYLAVLHGEQISERDSLAGIQGHQEVMVQCESAR